MHLIFSTDDYVLGTVSRTGFPILLWNDLSSCAPGNEFFRFYLQRGFIESQKSWEPIARALYDYFSFLEAHDLDWNNVSRGEYKNLPAAYRDYSFDVVKLSRNTVRHRLVYVCAFYEYALQRQWIAQLPYANELRILRRSGGFFSHVNSYGKQVSIPSVMPRKHKNLPKYLTVDQARNLLRTAVNPHHHAIIRLGLQTGLRREELATFPLSYIFNPDVKGVLTRNVRVKLDPYDGSGIKTKGSKVREIFMSRHLMKVLHHYAIHYRGERASLTEEKYPQLFLNQDGNPWAGDGKGMESMIRDIGRRAGLHAHPHMLRHTYATHTLASLQGQSKEQKIEPLVFLQRQLGHASLRSVEVYLHLINELADNAVLTYDDELNDWPCYSS